MAYTDYSISQNYDPAEEERKKREQEIAAMSGLPVQAQAPVVPQAPQVPGTEFGQFAQQIQQPTPVSPQDLTNIQQMTQVPGTQVAGPMPQQDTNQYANYPDQTQNETQRLQAQAQAPVDQGQATRGIVATPGAQQQVAQNTTSFDQALIQSQGDQKKMWEIYNNSQYTPAQRQVAGVQLSDMMKQDYAKNQATQFIRNATPEDLNKMLASRSSEGSWGKAIMYGLLGMEASAKDEAAKLGVGAKWQSQMVMNKDGTTSNILYKMRADGLPMEGYNAETGKQLGSKELAGLVAGGQKLDMVGGTYVNDKTGEVGRVVSDKNTGQSWIQTDQGRKPLTGFRPQSSMGTLDDMRTRKIQEINLALQGKTAEEKMRILRDYNSKLVAAGEAIVQPNEVGMTAPQISGGILRPGTTQAAPAQTTTQPAPAQTGTTATTTPAPARPAQGTGTGGRPTGAELGARTKVIDEAAKQVAASADTQNMLNSIDKTVKMIDEGQHNIGHAAGGLTQGELTGETAQRWGERLRTTDAKNTKLIMDTVNKLAADGLKVLGSNPSTADLEFWTRYKPDISSDPAFVKEWIESRSADLKRRLGYAEKQMGAGGGAGAAPSAVSNQWKIISVEPGR